MCASFSTSGPSPSTKKREKKLFWPSTQNWQMFELWRDKRQKSGGLFDETGWFRFGWFFWCAYPKDGDKRAHMFHGFNFKHTHTHTHSGCAHGEKSHFLYKINFRLLNFISIHASSLFVVHQCTATVIYYLKYFYVTSQSIHFWHGDILSLWYEWSVSTLSLLKPWTGLKSNCSPQWVDVDPHHHLHTWGINV